MNSIKSFVEVAWDLYQKVDTIEESNSTGWGFISSLSFVLTVTAIYLTFVLFVGPRMMKNVPPLNITGLMLSYNFIQVVFNVFLFRQMFKFFQLKLNETSIQCINVEPYESTYYEEIRFTMWMVVINKILDLIDTVFFVLRKKWSHLTFLHIYHHTLTFTGSWYLARFAPGGTIIFYACMNTLVHTFMHSYYFMAACPYFGMKNYAKYLRKTVTRLQIIQFIIAGIYVIWASLDRTCTYPRELIYFGISQDALMLFLFTKFYIQTYLRSKKEPQRLKATSNSKKDD